MYVGFVYEWIFCFYIIVKCCLLEESSIIDKIWKVCICIGIWKVFIFFFIEKSEIIVVFKMYFFI